MYVLCCASIPPGNGGLDERHQLFGDALRWCGFHWLTPATRRPSSVTTAVAPERTAVSAMPVSTTLSKLWRSESCVATATSTETATPNPKPTSSVFQFIVPLLVRR